MQTRVCLVSVLLAGIAVFLAACIDVDLTETPPSLQLSEPAVVQVFPTHVRITNGAGEVLVDQDLTSPYRVEANPPPEKLDGTLTVETRWDNGTTTSQRLSHTPGKKIKLAQSGRGYVLTELTEQPQSEGADGGDGD